MSKINVESVAKVIDEMADTLERSARELRDHAAAMRKNDDLSRASEAMNVIQNIFANIRLDLITTRIVRVLTPR